MATPGRLRSGREFDAVFQEGIAVSGPLFVVRARPNGLRVARVGYAVGKRIAPLSTVRNRARRRLREAIRAAGLPPGYDLVVIARPAALQAPFAQLVAAARRAIGVVLERQG